MLGRRKYWTSTAVNLKFEAYTKHVDDILVYFQRGLSLSFKIHMWKGQNYTFRLIELIFRLSLPVCDSGEPGILSHYGIMHSSNRAKTSHIQSTTLQGKWICGVVFLGKGHWGQFVGDGSVQFIILWTELGRTGWSWRFTCTVIKTRKNKKSRILKVWIKMKRLQFIHK